MHVLLFLSYDGLFCIVIILSRFEVIFFWPYGDQCHELVFDIMTTVHVRIHVSPILLLSNTYRFLPSEVRICVEVGVS